MKTALRISLVLAAVLGFASPGLGQGSMTRFTASAQSPFGRTKSLSSPSTNGFTISAQRHFDDCVAVTASSATRYWFLDFSAPSESLVAAGRYENATLWAQGASAKPGPAFAGNGRTLHNPGGLITVMAREHSPAYAINRGNAGDSHSAEDQLPAWIRNSVHNAKVDPVP